MISFFYVDEHFLNDPTNESRKIQYQFGEFT